MPNIEFQLTSEFIPLCDLLKVTGLVPSGGVAKMLIADGMVDVDGKPELRKTCKIRANQIVLFEDTRINVKA